MAKKIRFPLEMKDGVEVRDIAELKENFSLEHVLVYLADGKLITWLRDRYQNEIADAVLALNCEDADFHKKICDIFEVEYMEMEEDIEKAIERKRKETLLKEFTDDERFHEVIEQTAFTQDDLYDLLDEGITEIYLCGEKFSIPIGKKGVKYIGINHPMAVISSKEKVDFNEKNITFQGIQFDEKYEKILSEDVFSDEVLENDNKTENASYDIFADGELKELHELADGLSEDAWKQINHLTDHLREYIDSFLQKTLKHAEKRPIFFTTSSYFDCIKYDCKERNNIFLEKVNGQEVIEVFVNDIRAHYKELKKDIMRDCRGYIGFIEDNIMIFIVEFKKIFFKYMWQECGEEARIYAQRGMEVVTDKNKLIKRYDDFHAMEKVKNYIQELFGDPIDRAVNMCIDTDDGFAISDIIDSITDNMITNFDEARAVMEVRMEKLYFSILTDYFEGVRSSLSVMYNAKVYMVEKYGSKYNTPGAPWDWDLNAMFMETFKETLKEVFGNDTQPTIKEEKKTDVSSWWNKHLANAHKSSDKQE